MKLFVTGAAGFIGSNYVRHVLETSDDEVVIYDLLTYAGNMASIEDVLGPRVSFVQGDICDRDSVAAAMRGCDQVVHFAAESHVDRSIDGPRAFIDTNVVGTFELLEAARAHCAALPPAARGGFRFLHVSTDEVYGSLGADGYFTEATPYAPNSPYSASKASADLLVRAYHHTYGLPTITTNCSNNYGPYQFPEKLIPLMLLNALEGKPLPIYGDGGNVRDWIHVEDHCAGILRALEAGEPGEQYAFGGESERSNLQVVDGLCAALEAARPAAANEALRRQGARRYADLKQFVVDRPGHDRRYAIDASKAKRALGWAPARRFEAALAETVGWYLAHEPWRRAIQAEGDARRRQGLAIESPGGSATAAGAPGGRR